VDLLVADLDRVQRRLSGEHPAVLEQGPHVVVDQREQQAADVAAVDVGVAQDDDASVPGILEVEVAARPGTDRRDQRLRLGVLDDLLQVRLAGVHDLAAQRQHRHVLGVASGLGRARRPSRPRRCSSSASHAVGAAVGELVGHAGRAQVGGLALGVERSASSTPG
jgi:hypothetical protein